MKAHFTSCSKRIYLGVYVIIITGLIGLLLYEYECKFNGSFINLIVGIGNVRICNFMFKDLSVYNKIDKMGRTPLYYAGTIDMIRYILLRSNKHVSIDYQGYTPLQYAAITGNVALATYFSKSDVMFKYGESVIYEHRPYYPPLLLSVIYNKEKVVNVLLRAGENINETDINGMGETPIFAAIKRKHYRIAKLLLQNGVECNYKIISSGETPLMACMYGDNDKMANLMIQNGAKLEIVRNDGNTALHIASIYGSVKCAKLLLKSGAFVNCVNLKGDTPLHLAIYRSNINIIKLLVEYNANINIANKGISPLELSFLVNNERAIKLMLPHR